MADVYRSEAQLTVTAADQQASKDQLDFLVGTYTQLAQTKPVVADAIRRSGRPVGLDTASGRISVTSSPTGGFIRVSATGPTPAAARSLADGEAAALVAATANQQRDERQLTLRALDEQQQSIQDRLRSSPAGSPEATALQAQYTALLSRRAALEFDPQNRVDQVQPATLSRTPIAPTPTRDAILAFLVALVVNAELVVLVGSLRGRFDPDHPEWIRELTGLPVLAAIPRGDGPVSVEAFRRLRTSLAFFEGKLSVRTVAVVSAERGAGKTRTAIGLARQTAALGVSVVLIDGDLRHPDIHRTFNIPLSPGVGDLSVGDDPEPLALRAADEPDLRVLPAGSPVDDPGACLSGVLAKTLAALASAELIVVDTPAASMFSEAFAVAAQCDGTIVVIDVDRSRRRPVLRLLDALRNVDAHPLGVVLNRTDPASSTRDFAKRAEISGPPDLPRR